MTTGSSGPMTAAHGRHAAYGDSLARIMDASGRKVSREYYINDGGNQIRLLAESVAARYAGLFGRDWLVSDPDGLYKGEYIRDIAEALKERAAAQGRSLSAYVNAQLAVMAARPTNAEITARLRTRDREDGVSTARILDEVRAARR